MWNREVMAENFNMPNIKRRKGTSKLPFKDTLSALMRERRLTVKEVAALAGVSSSVVQNWLEGKNPHDLHAVSQLADKLGVPFKKLLLNEVERVDLPTTVGELFDEQDWFNGFVRLDVKRLVPKKKG